MQENAYAFPSSALERNWHNDHNNGPDTEMDTQLQSVCLFFFDSQLHNQKKYKKKPKEITKQSSDTRKEGINFTQQSFVMFSQFLVQAIEIR